MTNDITTEETTPQRARRLGREYADTFHDRWSGDGRKWIRFAFAKGYQKSCEDLSDAVDKAIVSWEASGDAEALVAALDNLLDHIDGRTTEAAA